MHPRTVCDGAVQPTAGKRCCTCHRKWWQWQLTNKQQHLIAFVRPSGNLLNKINTNIWNLERRVHRIGLFVQIYLSRTCRELLSASVQNHILLLWSHLKALYFNLFFILFENWPRVNMILSEGLEKYYFSPLKTLQSLPFNFFRFLVLTLFTLLFLWSQKLKMVVAELPPCVATGQAGSCCHWSPVESESTGAPQVSPCLVFRHLESGFGFMFDFQMFSEFWGCLPKVGRLSRLDHKSLCSMHCVTGVVSTHDHPYAGFFCMNLPESALYAWEW